MLTHTAKPQIVLTTGGVDVVFRFQEFKSRLFGSLPALAALPLPLTALRIGSALPGFLAIFLKLNQHSHPLRHRASRAPGSGHNSHIIFLLTFPRPSLPFCHAPVLLAVNIHQINVNLRAMRSIQGGPFSEDSAFRQLLLSCGSCSFSRLAVFLFRESQSRVILIGVKLLPPQSKPALKNKSIVTNPGSYVSLSACDSLFVISPSKAIALTCLTTVLRKYALAQLPRPTSAVLVAASPDEPKYLSVELPPFLIEELSEISHPPELEPAVISPPSFRAEFFRLCPFIRLEKDQTIAEAQSHEFLRHLVLIFSSSGSKDLVPVTALMLSIMNFLESYRFYSQLPMQELPSPRVIVLSERADELAALTERIGFSQSSLLVGVSFYLGSPKNIDHLRLCRIVAAKAVVILQPPVTYYNWLSSSSTPLPSINEDKHSIIVSLNIHHLIHTTLSVDRDQSQLEQWREDHFDSKRDDEKEETLPPSSPSVSQIPFLVAHLHDISNVSYLLPHGPQPPMESKSLPIPPWDDWNLLSSGGVLTQYLFYSILLHSLLTPDLLSLWEDLLHFPENHLDSSSLSPSHLSPAFRPKLQRIRCPIDCIGLPYLRFVESLISDEGEIGPIPIAVYRENVTGGREEKESGATLESGWSDEDCNGCGRRVHPTECLCRRLPYLFLTPPNDFLLQRSDFIFFFNSL
jgi:hypothetical protein